MKGELKYVTQKFFLVFSFVSQMNWLNPFQFHRIYDKTSLTNDDISQLYGSLIFIDSHTCDRAKTLNCAWERSSAHVPSQLIFSSTLDLFFIYVCHNAISWKDCEILLAVCYIVLLKYFEDTKRLRLHTLQQINRTKYGLLKCKKQEVMLLQFFDYHFAQYTSLSKIMNVFDMLKRKSDFHIADLNSMVEVADYVYQIWLYSPSSCFSYSPEQRAQVCKEMIIENTKGSAEFNYKALRERMKRYTSTTKQGESKIITEQVS